MGTPCVRVCLSVCLYMCDLAHPSQQPPPPPLQRCLAIRTTFSIYDNITYGLEEGEFTEEDVYTAAKQACAHEFITGFAGAT